MGMPEPNGPWSTDGLPDLPPEWGRVVVPDDASALAQEAAQVRRELHEARRAARLRSFRRTLTLPLLILVVAVLTTLAGLVAVTWPRAERPAARPSAPAAEPAADPVGRPLPALDLVDETEAPVPVRSLLPAVILLVDACPCPERVIEAAGAAPPGVRVVTVVGGGTVPASTDPVPGVRRLADPAGGMRALTHTAPVPGAVGALLVDRTGTVVRVVPVVGSVEDYRGELTRLAG
ncbi:hypothetical protein [Micromonospora sagamiensis]|uniref:Uncharacterized protein n=1 Tax=Micromonospora sagamiensis TaxID=47875 RepID=A0A562WAS9_9ACTN|nr:hypothetical protein [Micromonospora sagamiensis]TWJ26764.1 hypothetical protein JD81_00227 [Micromonospora sagamiensis]BCL14348.1 hypothetical protein GCM10017556_20870 [Micromonospora sagamiensis]